MASVTHVHLCHMLKLPAELRLRIYDFVLIEDKPVTMFDWGGPPASDIYDPSEFRPASYMHEPALLHTSKTIRLEAAPVFYGKNIFEYPWSSPTMWKKCIERRSSEQQGMLRFVRVATPDAPSSETAKKVLKGARKWIERANINVSPHALYAEESPRKWTNGIKTEPGYTGQFEFYVLPGCEYVCWVESS